MAESRRQFLKWLSATGVVAGAAYLGLDGDRQAARAEAGPAHAGDHGAQDEADRQWCMVIDLKKCDGCEGLDGGPGCVEACAKEHAVPEGQQWIKIHKQSTEGGGSYYQPTPCMQCENAPCQSVCPVGATYFAKDGPVLIDHDRCIGCRFCIAACPYGARSFNWTQPKTPPGYTFANYSPEYPVPSRKGTVNKCMMCAHRLRNGKLSACAEGCPMNAIYIGDRISDLASNGVEVVQLSAILRESQAYRVKEDLGTRPRVYYLPGYGQEFGRRPL